MENGNWASDISNNNVFTTDFKVVSSLPYNEYILIESADDVEEWFKENLSNLTLEALSFDEERKAAKITFNKPVADPGLYIRGIAAYAEDYPYMAMNIEVKGQGAKGGNNMLYVWGDEGMISVLGAGKLKEGSYTVCYDLNIEGLPFQMRWDPYITVPDGFNVEIYIKYVAFFKSAEAALAFDGDFSVLENNNTTPTPSSTPEENERTPKPIVTNGTNKRS